MRKDWDYVELSDYEKDMKESSDTAVRAINFVRERAEKAEKMLALVVLSAGEVKIDRSLLDNPGKIELTTRVDHSDMSCRISAARS